MTRLLLILLSFSTYAVFAASNITVTVDGKTYICSGSSAEVDCSGKVKGFEATLASCARVNDGSYCSTTNWPKYKEANPGCIGDGIPACIQYCSKVHDGAFCASKCQ